MRYAWCMAAICSLLFSCGCSSDQERIQDNIDAGEVALGGNRYDAAVADADAAINIHPTAEAYYLRGRAEEDRPKPDDQIAAADLASARTDYKSALDQQPSKPLAARCRAGLANIAFIQGDYDVALYEWTIAIDDLEDDRWKAQALFHMGECQQRLGRFDDADKTFKRVTQLYPDQEVANEAQGRIGVHGFYVQLGTFANLSDAQAAMTAASTAGLSCRQTVDNGQTTVRCGPYSTYADAQRGKTAIAAQYPDATVGP